MFAKSAPWTVPVPVSTLSAQPLDPAHAGYAIRVDLARIGSFGFAPSRHADVALADLQLNADANVPLRLGSGRAVSYAGAYIKGVGRTQLAANWRAERDLYHASGHLFPSGAAREYLVTRYMHARGLGHTIVPCDGLLLARAPAGVRTFAARVAQIIGGGTPAPIDTKLLALSVKPARFGRFSNVLWALSRVGAHDPIAPVLRAFRAILDGDDASAQESSSRCTPSDLAAALGRAVERAFDVFCTYPLAGVYFWSFHNNFTADGRFVDLETPVVMGAPFAGAIVKRDFDPRTTPLHELPLAGLEVAELVAQTRAFLDALDAHLGRIERGSRLIFPAAASFAAQLREAIAVTFPATHPLRSIEALEASFVDALGPVFDWSPGQRAFWSALLRARLAMRIGGNIEPVTADFRPVAIDLPDVEPGLPTMAWTIDGTMPDPGALEPARAFTEALRAVEACTEIEPALDAVRRGARIIEAAAGPGAARVKVAS